MSSSASQSSLGALTALFVMGYCPAAKPETIAALPQPGAWRMDRGLWVALIG
jgi:hypothetical protein